MFGVGYNMTMEKVDAISFEADKVEALITSRVPDAKVLTNVGAEMTIQLPFASSSQFEPLFSYIDDNSDALGIRSYGMSVTTLEEVFINVAHGTKTQAHAEKGRLISSEVKTGKIPNPNQVAAAEVVEDIEANDTVLADFDKIDPNHRVTSFFRHMYAMLMKRYLYFIRDTKSWVLQIILPVLFVLAGMLIMSFSSYISKQPRLALNTDLYNDKIDSNYNPFAYSANSYFCPPDYYNTNSASVANGTCYAVSDQTSLIEEATGASNWPLNPVSLAATIGDMSEYLSNRRTDREAMQVAGLTYTQTNFVSSHISDVHYVVHSNYTAIHGAPLGSAYAIDGIVQSIDPDASVTVKLHPLPFTGQEAKIFNSYNANLIATFVMLAIPFIPASWATYIVREREVKAKHVQLVSGVSIAAYWLATYLWDILAYQLTMWGIIILFVSFPDTESVSSEGTGALGVVIGVFLLFGPAMAGFTYLTTFFFANPSSVQVTLIFVVFVLGFLLTIVGYILRLIPSTTDIYLNGLRYLFAIFPPFALGDCLQNLTLRDSISIIELEGGEVYSVHDWKISGLSITFLAWESVAYIGLTILYEYLKALPWFQGIVSLVKASDLPPANDSVKDEDVLAEEKRVLLPETAENSTILVKDLKKMYPGGKYAVRGVSLGIPNGECFGLLGINGAGKSSLLAMLSGETQPTAGDAYLGGLNLLTDIHECRRKIGFCPQFDALFELLTGREHLQLYARIKGIVEKDVERVVNYKIAEMGLTEYADRAAGTYSGGNKRKLSVAIAMIGDPEIVFLDEPSTGMDPVARRFMWEVITNIVTKRESCSMILTTHSMEECEALCTRIGIMVGGALRCLGSSQRLRSRYGTGYQLEFGFVIPSDDQIVTQVNQLVSSLNLTLPPNSSATADYALTLAQVMNVIPMLNRPQWIDRVSYNGTAQELYQEIKASGYIHARSFANWIIMEENYDRLVTFLDENFPGYEVRERQVSKLRIVVPELNDGQKRKLSALFGAVEKNKESLYLEEYSVCQTSLEQIFNHFASQVSCSDADTPRYPFDLTTWFC
jgi:ATP-binding cassette, subfamily A (ABC1), member 3